MLEETLDYAQAAFAGTHLDSRELAEWLFLARRSVIDLALGGENE